jgi:Uma2 family endonuclease
MIAKAPPFRFTVDQYDQMIETGILTEDDRVELIRGEIVPKMPSGPRHAGIIKRLIRLLGPQMLGRAILDAQNPVHLADSELEPDVAVLAPNADDYEGSHPGPRDLFLLFEVADSSLDRDRDEKASLYAENGISEYWIVNLDDDIVLVHRNPQLDGTWASITTHVRGDTLDIASLPGVTIAVADMLP